ncbi:MAG: efflux RND transporter permease subunit [Spirochaetota bacterium]
MRPRFSALFWPFWLYHIRKHAWLMLGLLFVTSFIGYRYGRRIRVDTNLLNLLPAETESLVRLTQLRDASDVKGFLVVTFESDTPRSERELTAMAERLEATIASQDFLRKSTSKVIYGIPGEFLLRYSLWYADYGDLVKVRDRLDNSIRQAKRRENPYFEDLEESAPAPFYIGDVLNKYRKKYLSSGSFIDNDHKRIAVLLSLREPPDNIQFAQSYLAALRDSIRSEAERRQFKLHLSGRYASDVEKQRRLAEDISQSTTITLLILVASLVIFFRSLRVLLVVGLPVMAALGYTYWAAWYFIGEISIISSFLTSILLGLGIDYGIHLFARYKGERVKGHGMTESLEITMRNLFRGLSFGMISTAAVFLTLSFSRFIAFAEFGRIALGGVLFFFAAFVLYFPALVFLTEKFSFGTTEASHILEKTRRIRGWQMAIIVFVAVYGAVTAFRPPFEYDFFELESTDHRRISKEGQHRQIRIIENREHMVIYELPNWEALRATEQNLRALATGSGLELHSALDLVPTDVARKQVVIRQMNALLKQAELYAFISLDAATLARIRQGLRMTEGRPVTLEDIPEAFRQHLIQDGRYYLYAFPRAVSELRRGALDFAAKVRETCSIVLSDSQACPAGNKVRGISDLYVLDDILDTVMRDFAKQIALIAVVIAVIVLSLTRRLAGVTLILAPLAVGILALFALIGIFHQLSATWLFELNYINLLAIPILLGVGIDNGIYLYSHARESGLSQVNQIMASTGGSIFISNFTTSMGFLSLTISSHRGLASFGFLTFAGMLCIFYAYRLLFPALARWFQKAEVTI